MAEILSGLKSRALKFAHTSATVAGTPVLIAGRVLIPQSSVLANITNIFHHFAESVESAKAAVAITAGAAIYWDDTAKLFTTVLAANTKCGIALEDAAIGSVNVIFELNNTVNL